MNRDTNNFMFMKQYTASYDLDAINADKALFLANNINYGGRVANFIIDEIDINYYKLVLDHIFDNKTVRVNDTKDLLYYIDYIAEWIQLRLNTRYLFRRKEWNEFNIEYVRKCFGKQNFKDLKKYDLKNTNIRNLFFGDCREHEVLLNVLTNLFLKKYNLQDKYIVRRFYAKGVTIKDEYESNKNKLSYIQEVKYEYTPKYHEKPFVTDHVPGGSSQLVGTWDHTHPLLYDIAADKIYSIDALRHKTKWNPVCDVTHNVELELINMVPNSRCVPCLNYKNMIDGSYRAYIETPTPFSNTQPTEIPPGASLLFSHKFVLDTNKLTGKKKYATYGKHTIIDVGDLINDNTDKPYSSLFDHTIDILCLKKENPSASLKRTATIHNIDINTRTELRSRSRSSVTADNFARSSSASTRKKNGVSRLRSRSHRSQRLHTINSEPTGRRALSAIYSKSSAARTPGEKIHSAPTGRRSASNRQSRRTSPTNTIDFRRISSM